MSDNEAPPTKRIRRGMEWPAASVQSRYLLRSRARSEGIGPEEIPLPQPKRKTRNRIEKLMDLSNDCLLEIIENADLTALSNIAATCDRLRDLTRYIFRVKHRRFNFISLFANAPIRLSAAKMLLRFFGDLIVSLNMTCSTFASKENLHDKLLSLVRRYCTNLKELSLEDFILTNESSFVLEELNKLVLDNCVIRNNNLSAMVNLKTLELVNCDCDIVLHQKFENLVEFRVKDAEGVYYNNFAQFLNVNRKLKHLSLIRCYNVSSKILQYVGLLNDLEEFDFQLNSRARSQDNFQNDLDSLVELKKMKKMKLNCNTFPISQMLEKFVKNSIEIEDLELSNGPIDNATYDNLNKLKSLKSLKLNEMTDLSDARVVGFGKHLKLLEHLHIKAHANVTRSGIMTLLCEARKISCLKLDMPSFNLNYNMYKDILSVVQKRDPLVKLTLSIFGDGQQFTGADAVEQNKQWFTVEDLNRENNRIFENPATTGGILDEFTDDEFEDDEEEDDMFLGDGDGWDYEEEEEEEQDPEEVDDEDEVDAGDVFGVDFV